MFLLCLYAFLCKCLGLYDLFCFIFLSGHLRQIWTGGVAGLWQPIRGSSIRRKNWHSLFSRSPLPYGFYWGHQCSRTLNVYCSLVSVFRNWWPGWKGERKGLPMEMRDTDMGIKLSRSFEHRTQTNRSKLTRFLPVFYLQNDLVYHFYI